MNAEEKKEMHNRMRIEIKDLKEQLDILKKENTLLKAQNEVLEAKLEQAREETTDDLG